MIFPEHLIRLRLQRSIDAINRDPARQFLRDVFAVESDFSEAELSQEYHEFYRDDPGIVELDGMVDQAIEWWEKQPPTVHLCLNWAMIDQPGVHIDYGSENGEGFIGQNLAVEDSDSESGVIHKVGDVFSVPSTVLWVMTENKEWTLLLYYIIKAILHLDWLWYARYGLRDMQITGGNVDRQMMLLPNVGFYRQLTLKYQYNCWVHRTIKAPLGTNFTVSGSVDSANIDTTNIGGAE